MALTWGCAGPAPAPESETQRFKLAAVPFEVNGQENGGSTVGVAFTQSIVAALSQVRDLDVQVVDRAAIGEDMGHSVSGMLVRDGARTLVSAELRDTTTDSVVWASGERDADSDLSEISRQLAKEIVAALDLVYPTLYPYIDNVSAGPEMSNSPLFVRAADARSRGALEEWVEISAAIAEQFGDDPAAHVLHAWALTLAWDAEPREETLAVLRERLTLLDRVDPSSPYDDLIRAYVYRSSGEPGQARVMYSWVLDGAALSSSARAWALRQRALAGLQIGDAESAGRDAREAVALDPLKPANLIALSKALEALGRIDEAADASRQALALEPHWRHHQRLGLVLGRAARYEEAIRSFRTGCDLGNNQETCANLAVTLERAGDSAAARDAATYATSLTETAWGAYNLACYRALAGDTSGALRGLDRAIELGFADTLIATDPDLDSLRGIPRFQKIAAALEDRLTSRHKQSSSIFPWQS